MRMAILPCLVAGASLAAPQARAQSLQSEQVQGNRRICYYGASNGLLSGSQQGAQHSVGAGENCPVTMPLDNSDRPVPPTAALSTDRPSSTGRICVYEQWGSRWTFNLRGRTGCPPTAGMIPSDQRSAPDPSEPPPLDR